MIKYASAKQYRLIQTVTDITWHPLSCLKPSGPIFIDWYNMDWYLGLSSKLNEPITNKSLLLKFCDLKNLFKISLVSVDLTCSICPLLISNNLLAPVPRELCKMQKLRMDSFSVTEAMILYYLLYFVYNTDGLWSYAKYPAPPLLQTNLSRLHVPRITMYNWL